MNKEFVEKIENKVNSIDILDKDPFVEESCKNIYRALLVVAENENPPISDISDILNDTNKTTELLKKFDNINREKYNGDLSYIVVDINNNQTLLYLIELLRQSIYYNGESNDKEIATNDKSDKDINITRINKILSSVFRTSQIVKIEKIDSIKFLPSKVGYTIEVKDNHDKFYYMFVDDELCYVAQVRENSIDGKIVFVPDDDYIPPTTNNFNDNKNNISQSNKNIYTIDQQPWIEYLEIDEETGERKLRADAPEEIVKKYNEFNNSKLPINVRTNDYILISSTGYFSKKKINNCFVSLIENKIYNYTYDSNNNDKYDYLKDLTSNQKDKLMKYINDNDLLNVNINNVVFDASDIIEINISGKKNIIRNASKEFTNNEMHIFDDIVDIVFNDNNSPLEKIKNFFSMDLKNDKDITKFAQDHGYKGAKYNGKWKEYKVYEPYMDENGVSYIGLPLAILVNNQGEIRMSTSDEAMAIIDDDSYMESFEENRINEELNFSNRQEAVDAYMKKFGGFPFMSFRGVPDDIVIEEVKEALKNNKEISIDFDDNDSFIKKYKIDENGKEYEENKKVELEKCPSCHENLLIMGNNKSILTCPKCKSNYMSLGGKLYSTDNVTEQDVKNLIGDIDNKIAELEIEKEKIDKEIEKNLDEVSKYSILNKTLEELLSAKKKFINDWDVLLFNTISEHWIMNSATYRVHIVSIIDAILRRIDDSVSKQQLELLNNITDNKYFSNQDRDSVIRIVKQLKELENK